MIWTLIGIIGFIFGFVFIWISCKAEKKYFDTREDKWDTIYDIFGITGICLAFASGLILLVCIGGIICAHTYAGKSNVLEMQEKYDALVAAQTTEQPVTVQNQLYTEIAEYNTKLRKLQHWTNSKWTNWIYPNEYNDLKYIEY